MGCGSMWFALSENYYINTVERYHDGRPPGSLPHSRYCQDTSPLSLRRLRQPTIRPPLTFKSTMHFQGLVAANLPGHQYSIRESLRSFFAKTTVERPECDEKAIQLVGGTTVMPVTIQGNYSYTLYAGPSLEFIVQFRHLHLPIDVQTMALAREIHGELVPPILETGEMGTLRNSQEGTITSIEIPTRITPLVWHVFPRVQARCASGMAISYLDFLKTHRTPNLAPGTTTHQHLQLCRKTLINGVAR